MCSPFYKQCRIQAVMNSSMEMLHRTETGGMKRGPSIATRKIKAGDAEVEGYLKSLEPSAIPCTAPIL